jgi:histidinol dehydrogenase
MRVIEGTSAARAAILEANAKRAFSSNPQVEAEVRDICEAVRLHGDDAILEFTRKFDSPHFDIAHLRVSEQEIEAAYAALSPEARRALERAAHNIETFHSRQSVPDWSFTSTEGALLGQRYNPIERVGSMLPTDAPLIPAPS